MRSSAINKLFNFVSAVMFSLHMFIAGASFADNRVTDGITSLVLAGLWGGILLIEWHSRTLQIRSLRKLQDISDELWGEVMAMLDRVGAIKVTVQGAAPVKKPAKKASKK
jgi:hypothetical protein